MGKYFGTDGVRGLAGRDVSPTIAYRIGRFLGQYPSGKQNRVLIARDTRISGEMLASALIGGLTSSGSNIFTLGVSTTPSVSYLVLKHDFDFGIMISASHNPYFDNGIKIFNRSGEKLEESIELEIEQYIDNLLDDLPRMTGKEIGRLTHAHYLVDEYLDYIASKAVGKFDSYHILIDCANGSASELIDPLCRRLGIKADIINNTPDGLNINDMCGSTHIKGLQDKMKANGYDFGMAFDGDADRLLMIDNAGNIVDGDAMVYMAAIDKKRRGILKDNKVVLTVMSNIGVKLALKRAGIEILEVPVGDKYVQAALKKEHLVLGGEQSGHLIFFDDMNTGDGLLSMVKMLNIIAASGERLPDLLTDLKIFPQMLKNITVTNKKEVMDHPGVRRIIASAEAKLASQGRILVRPSGTEPLIRIMVEAPTIEICRQLVDEVYNYIAEAFIN